VDKRSKEPQEDTDTVAATIIAGRRTHIIAEVSVGGKDTEHFRYLLQRTAEKFRPDEVCADSAFATSPNFKKAAKLGVTLVAPFRKNATGFRGGEYERRFHHYTHNREEFRRRYRYRNNIESVNSMLKRRFSKYLDLKTDAAIKSEIMGLVLIHNICCLIRSDYYLGVDQDLNRGR
jgi:hypothetical protein